jgi:hypothetical protein
LFSRKLISHLSQSALKMIQRIQRLSVYLFLLFPHPSTYLFLQSQQSGNTIIRSAFSSYYPPVTSHSDPIHTHNYDTQQFACLLIVTPTSCLCTECEGHWIYKVFISHNFSFPWGQRAGSYGGQIDMQFQSVTKKLNTDFLPSQRHVLESGGQGLVDSKNNRVLHNNCNLNNFLMYVYKVTTS